MKKLIKITAALLALILALTAVSCGKKKPSVDDGGKTVEDDPRSEPGDEPDDAGEEEEPDRHTIHVFGKWTTVTEASCFESGKEERVCSECNYRESRDVEPTGHVYSKKWTSDGTSHWHEPVCGDTEEVKDLEAHDFVVEQIPVIAGTDTEGKMILVCSVCNRAKTEVIPKGSHSVVYRPEIPATCDVSGRRAYYECLDCGKLFSDKEATNEVTLRSLAIFETGHNKSEEFGFDGEYHWHVCTLCGKRFDLTEHTDVSGSCTVCQNVIPVYSKGIEYTLSEDGSHYTVSGIGTASGTEIIIAPSYKGVPVTGIDNGAFSGKTAIRSVTIPEGVVSIGAEAFKGCRSLNKINIPDSVRLIENGVFNGCTSLEYDSENGINYLGNWVISVSDVTASKLTVRKGTVGIYYGSFLSCEKLVSLTLPDTLRVIESYAFIGCLGLKNVTLPQSLETIGEKAFLCCGLKSVVLPLSLSEAGSGIFFGCPSLTGIYLESYSVPSGFAYDWDDGAECPVLTGESWSYVSLEETPD